MADDPAFSENVQIDKESITMSIKIGINGFGRIGRSLFRAISQDPAFADIEVVHVNDLTDNFTLAHLLKYDSNMGPSGYDISSDDNGMTIDGNRVSISEHRNPAEIPWGELGVDYVAECTGFFRSDDSAQAHLDAGAKKVVISAPAKGDVKTFVMGVNEDEYDATRHHIVSNASCTTNCLAPFAKVILDNFGIERGLMTTVHAYTGDQRLLDAPHRDHRRGRAAALSMVPTKTGAAAAVALVIPELKGKFVNEVLKAAANRYLGYCDEPLVSIDFKGNSHSSIIDAPSTKVLGRTVKILSWYDNEWGYANRMLDLIKHMDANRAL